MAFLKVTWLNDDDVDFEIGVSPSFNAENMNRHENAMFDLDANKVDKMAGKGLSTNDYTTNEKNILAGTPALINAKENADITILKEASVIDNLTSTDANKPLSANQGKVLKALTDTFVGLTVEDNLLSTDVGTALSANQGLVLKGFIDSINGLLTSDDTTLDELQEIVTFIKQNKSTLDALGVSNIAGLQTALNLKVDQTTLDAMGLSNITGKTIAMTIVFG